MEILAFKTAIRKMKMENDIVILPPETFSNTSSSANSFIRVEKLARGCRKNEIRGNTESPVREIKTILKKTSHLSQKEISPEKLREKFLKKIDDFDFDKENLVVRRPHKYHTEAISFLGDNLYYDISDVSSLDLNSSADDGYENDNEEE